MLAKTVCRPCDELTDTTNARAVRMAAKELTSLVIDEERLRAERADRKSWKSRVTGIEEYPGAHQGANNGEGSNRRQPDRDQRRQRRTEEEDLELRLALEASKNEAEEEKKRRERSTATAGDDDDLAKAIKLSKEEEELRRRELEQTNADLLFGDAPAQSNSYQPTGNNQGYQQQGQVDWFGNLVDQNQQQPQNTGFLNNAYSQPTGMQPQQTGFQNGMGGYGGFQQQQQQPQPTGFDQFGNQQQQFIQPQQTSFNMNNPYGQYGGGYGDMGQQQQQPQQPLQQQDTLQPGSHNPWAANKPQESLMPQPTGSNNPFPSTDHSLRKHRLSPHSAHCRSKRHSHSSTTRHSTHPYLLHRNSLLRSQRHNRRSPKRKWTHMLLDSTRCWPLERVKTHSAMLATFGYPRNIQLLEPLSTLREPV
jgi:epsin